MGNVNLMRAFVPHIDIGVERETFFYSQVRKGHSVACTGVGDFVVDGKWTFEVGGKGKGFGQIANIPSSYVVNDEMSVGYGSKIPLWLFGFLYSTKRVKRVKCDKRVRLVKPVKLRCFAQ